MSASTFAVNGIGVLAPVATSTRAIFPSIGTMSEAPSGMNA